MRATFISLAAAVTLLAAPALAGPGDMSVGSFLAKADALKAKGMGALFSPDIKVLKAEGMAAGLAYRDRLRAEKAQGKPSSCPPQGVKVNSNDLLGHLRSYEPAARTGKSMKAAMADYFIKTWPCR